MKSCTTAWNYFLCNIAWMIRCMECIIVQWCFQSSWVNILDKIPYFFQTRQRKYSVSSLFSNKIFGKMKRYGYNGREKPPKVLHFLFSLFVFVDQELQKYPENSSNYMKTGMLREIFCLQNLKSCTGWFLKRSCGQADFV